MGADDVPMLRGPFQQHTYGWHQISPPPAPRISNCPIDGVFAPFHDNAFGSDCGSLSASSCTGGRGRSTAKESLRQLPETAASFDRARVGDSKCRDQRRTNCSQVHPYKFFCRTT